MDEKSRLEREKEQILKLREQYRDYQLPGVSMVLSTAKPKYLNNIIANLDRIKYPKVEYIIIIHNSRVDTQVYAERLRGRKNVRLLVLPENYSLGDCLNYGVELAKYDYIGKMDDDDYYGANFIGDLMLAFQYTNAQIVGKGVHFVYFEANQALGLRLPLAVSYSLEDGRFYVNRYTYGPSLSGGALIAKRGVFTKVRFSSVSLGEDVRFMKDCTRKNIPIYAVDPFNYVYMRHGDRMDHTWNVNSQFVFRQAKIIQWGSNFEELVTV